MLKLGYMLIGLVNADPMSTDDHWILGPFEYPSFEACVADVDNVVARYKDWDHEEKLQIVCTSYPPVGKYRPK